MKLDKKTFKFMLLLLICVILFAWLLINIRLLLGFAGKLLGILSPFFLGLCLAFLVNIIMRPVEGLWRKLRPKGKGSEIHKKLSRPLSIVLSLLIVFGILFAIVFIVVPEFTRTLMSFAERVPEYAGKIEAWWAELSAFLEGFAEELPKLELKPQELVAKLTNFIARGGMSVLGTTGSIVSGFANFFVALVFSIYILAQKERFGVGVKRVLYALLSPERVKGVLDFGALVGKAFTSFVTGQLTEAVIIGALCFGGMLILNMPYAPVISVLVGFTALIPVFGAFIGTGVGAFLILLDSPVKAFWFVVFIIVLQQFEGNLIYPRVVGKSVGLPSVFTLMAVTIGGSTFGVLGMLVSVPVFSILYTLLTTAVDKSLKRKGISDKTLS